MLMNVKFHQMKSSVITFLISEHRKILKPIHLGHPIWKTWDVISAHGSVSSCNPVHQQWGHHEALISGLFSEWSRLWMISALQCLTAVHHQHQICNLISCTGARLSTSRLSHQQQTIFPSMVATMLALESAIGWKRQNSRQHQTKLSLVASPTRTGEGSLRVKLSERCPIGSEMT